MTDEKLEKAKKLQSEIYRLEKLKESDYFGICNEIYPDERGFERYLCDEWQEELKKMISYKLSELQEEYVKL